MILSNFSQRNGIQTFLVLQSEKEKGKKKEKKKGNRMESSLQTWQFYIYMKES